jgi:hypothetical protein
MKSAPFIFFMLFPLLSMAQEKLNNLKAPTSPASSILGMQPATVLSPKSYQALEASLYSSFFSNNSFVIPNDFALEFTPYWAKNHSLSLQEYLFPKSPLDHWVRNSSFSLASSQNFILGDSSSSNSLAFGYRTTFYLGNKNDRDTLINFEANSTKIKKVYIRIAIEAEKLGDEIEEKKSAIEDKAGFLEAMKSVINNTAYQIYKNMDTANAMTEKILLDCDSLPPLDTLNPFEFIDKFKHIVDENLEGEVVFNEYKKYIKERQGFYFDIAYAGFLNFPSNRFEFSFLPRQSLWITPTYRFGDKMSFLKLTGVLRYDWYNTDFYKNYFPATKIYENNFDYGLAVAFEYRKFSFQFEIVGRNSNSEIPAGTDANGNELFMKEQKTDLQYIGSFNYNLMDQIVLTYNLGNRFEPILNPNSTLVSTLTLNFGFGAPAKNILDL